jgi:hypothetical protein
MNLPEEVVKESFDIWRQQPVTNAVLQAIKLHRESFSNVISSEAQNPLITDQQIRYNAVAIRTIDAIFAILTDSNKLMKILETRK